jgi:DNA-binding transcriptional MerR regulator
MALFGMAKKKPAQFAAESATGVPTDLVIQMRQQGYSNDQIIQNLQSQGYTSSQIFDALNQADIRGAVEAAPPGAAPAGPAPAPEAAMPRAPPAALPAAAPMPAPVPETERERIEEIAEAIIDEKWDELMKSVDKIAAWKEKTEAKIIKMEQTVKDLKERFEELHSGILAKIGEYDKGIRDVGSEIKAMEGVFKKVLPSLTENVSELSRITKAIKGKKKKD